MDETEYTIYTIVSSIILLVLVLPTIRPPSDLELEI